MIRSFATKETAALFANQRLRRFDGEWLPVARRKLAQLNRVLSVEELRVPPGNRLERLGVIGPGNGVCGATRSGESPLSGGMATPGRWRLLIRQLPKNNALGSRGYRLNDHVVLG